MNDLSKVPGNWLRKIIPTGYQLFTLQLTGTSALLMSNGEVDRDSELYRAFALLSKKKGKSLDDEQRLREMEWQLRLYLDAALGPYIPGKNIKEMLRSAATKWKRGEDIKRSLIVTADRIPLIYDGPRDQAGLWAAGFRYTAMCRNSGAGAGSVVRCRPKFDNWSLEAEIAFDPEDIDLDLLHLVVERSRKYGLGDYRPTFGSFDAVLVEGARNKPGAQGSALKARDPHETRGHKAHVERITGE